MPNHKTTILLVRHGQTDWNKAGKWQGHMDIPLNESGKQQAQLVAKRLANWPIEAMVSSDLKRAHETALAVAKPHGLVPECSAIWRERHIGDFQGKTRTEVRTEYPELWGDGILEPPNGETFEAMQQRANQAFQQVMNAHAGKMVAVASHGQLIHVLLAQIMGIEKGVYGRFSLRGNTGISIIEVNNGSPVVTRLNDTAHIDKW